MDVIAKALMHLSWADLAFGAAIIAIAAGLSVLLVVHARNRESDNDDSIERNVMEERRQLLLYCGDAKALADLAVQRHMSDTAFLQHFQQQPGYKILSAHFGDAFRDRLAQKRRHDGRADLATACRAECERLEQLWQLPELQGLVLQSH
jgi:hypothetical protein